MGREGSMALWVWKAQLGVMVGLLLLWESPPFFFFLPCDCMMDDLNNSKGAEEEPKLKDYIRNPERFAKFFPVWIDELVEVNEREFITGEFGSLAVAAAPDSEKKLSDKYIKKRKDVCWVLVGNCLDEDVVPQIMTSTGILVDSLKLEPQKEWIYRVPTDLENKKRKLMSPKQMTLRIPLKYSVPGQDANVTFGIRKGVLAGLTRRSAKFDGEVDYDFLLNKVLLSETTATSGWKQGYGQKLGKYGEGEFQGVYRLHENGKLVRKALLQLRLENIIPLKGVPKGKKNTANVHVKAFDLWLYDDVHPENDPTRISEGVYGAQFIDKVGPTSLVSTSSPGGSEASMSSTEDSSNISERSRKKRRIYKKSTKSTTFRKPRYPFTKDYTYSAPFFPKGQN